MRRTLLIALAFTAASAAQAQRIVELPAGEVNLVRPNDLYQLEPDRWHLAQHLWQDYAPCTPTQCEAGYTSGDLVVSAEHTAGKVSIVAAWRGCAASAFSELDIGERASGSERRRIAKQVQRVVKGLGKTCKITPPTVTALAGDWLFPEATTAN
jgi:hypothetical protein